MNRLTAVMLVCVVLSAAGVSAGAEEADQVVGVPLRGDEAEAFLSSAEVVGELESFD